MKARLLMKERIVLNDKSFAELVVWEVPGGVPGSHHAFKYRLALVVNFKCVLRYDNESGKGDHRHVGKRETVYPFTTPEQLLADFWRDVDKRLEDK